VAVLQHLLGLVIVFGIGWIVAQLTRYPDLWVPPATCLAAIWPRMLWYEHEMIAEVWLLATFVGAVALALPCGALKNRERLFWFLLALAAIVACKPHGRAIWAGLMVVAVASAGNPLRWGIKNLALVGLAALIALTAGSDRQASMLLLNTTLPFVATEGEPYAEYRAMLRPFVEKARADLPNYAANQRIYKKSVSGSTPMFGSDWVKLSKDDKLFAKVAKRLAIEGILSHPLQYVLLVTRKIGLAATSSHGGRFSPEMFWPRQIEMNTLRNEKPDNGLLLLYGMEGDALRQFGEERRQRTNWMAPWMQSLGRSLAWTSYTPNGFGQAPSIYPTLFGWLVLLGFAGCLWPRYFICRSVLWLPAVCYLYATYGVGDTLGRYFHPVDWVGIVMMALGLDLLATLIMNAVSSLRATPRVAAAP
jgi:hypothetical protein